MLKRKSVEQVTSNEFATKNLRSKIPRRKRSRISPILLIESSFHETSDVDVAASCNTTLDSLVSRVHHHHHNDVVVPNKLVVVPQQLKDAQNDAVSVSERSCVESCSIAAVTAVSHSPSHTTATVDQKIASDDNDDDDDDLVCDESLSYGDYEVTSSAVETYSGMFSSGGGGDWYEGNYYEDTSGSQFSEKAKDDDEPCCCFPLLNNFKTQFYCLNANDIPQLDDHYVEELTYWTFEDEEYEESYKLLRTRERNPAAKVTNYIEDYNNQTLFGGVILEQRLVMVDWIIQANAKQLFRKHDLHSETKFLGVRLFDRVLSKGCFKSRRNLQILGVACLTLAIRIEEEQPNNSVNQEWFYVGKNIYNRTEVVAMEWVVQEVLKFHCISTTIYNFLWFYLKAAEADEQMQRKAEYLARMTLLDHVQLRFWPSSVAAALVILVSLSAERDESCQRVMEVHVRTKTDDLPECIKSLEWLVKHAL